MTKGSLICAFWVIVFIAFSLRAVTLNQKGYWIDEILTLKNSTKAWPEMLVALKTEDNNKPPLYYIFMHQWLKAGQSETWARLPSAVFGALTCGLIFLIGCRLADPWVGTLVAAFLTFSPLHLAYSQEARMYALFCLLASVAFFFLIVFLQERKWQHLFFFGIFSVLVNYTFSYGFFFLGFCGLLLLAEWKSLGQAKALALLTTLVISFLLFVPWLIRMIQTSNSGEGAQLYKGSPFPAIFYTFYSLGYGFDLGPTTSGLQDVGWRYFPSHPFLTLLTLLGLTVSTVIFYWGIWESMKNRMLLATVTGGLGVFLFCPAIISLLKPTITYNPRYAILALIPFGLSTAVGIAGMWKMGLLSRIVIALYVALLAVALGNFYLNPAYWREDMRQMAISVHQLQPPPEIVVVNAGYLEDSVAYYYPGPGKLIAFSNSDPIKFSADTNQLQLDLQKTTRFAVIYSRPDYGDRNHQFVPWLKQHYQLVEQREWPCSSIYVFSNGHRLP